MGTGWTPEASATVGMEYPWSGWVVFHQGKDMSNWKLIAAVGAVLIVLASIYATTKQAAAPGSAPVPPSEGAVIAGAVVQSLDGSQVALKSFRGKWLLINIWATWCGPCRSEMPALNRVWDTEHPAGLEMIGISDEDPETLWAFLNQAPPDQAIHYPIANDPGARFKIALNVRAIPRTIIVDPAGHVKFDEAGSEDSVMLLQALSGSGFPVR